MPARPTGLPAVITTLALCCGAVLAVVGLVFCLMLGPSGRVEASTHIDRPGVAVVGRDVVAAGSSPVRVQATSASGQPVTLATALDDDARAVLGDARVVSVDSVHFLPRGLDVSNRGRVGLAGDLNTDVFLGQVTGAPASIEVTSSQLPQAVLVVAGTPASPRDEAIDLTLTWENRAWFIQSLLALLAGLALMAWGLLRLRRHRVATADDSDPAVVDPAPDAPGTAAPAGGAKPAGAALPAGEAGPEPPDEAGDDSAPEPPGDPDDDPGRTPSDEPHDTKDQR